ncbi:PREDICTED: NACHT, LRR and PYD domains-containing protein 6 [Chrysochloris asiatica]|uniref:NACHT, LRR and PYD domains-containing protein 6 n=1 Tax=Chrysochloris asiatica TaxID=185453 RepID=A0A9B0U730_CHRAS|nr:PREDICTED: NACHT, LRR and PYD domains-containing protein 6 [Chrysochloris asiatica]
MEEQGTSCSSLRDRAAVSRELLLAALEELSQEQLKRFRHKLRDAPEGSRSIPWGKLEKADVLDLVQQLVEFYGAEPALDVAQKALKRSDVRDVAAQLKAQRLQSLGPGYSVELSVSEYKKKYREHVLHLHAKVKERNARSVKITKRFTKLLIAPESPEAEDEELGPAEEPEPRRARRSNTDTFNRLFSRDEEGHRPLTVVLQGPAGIGKTMAAKKILYDWAAGKLYHGQVDFAFFLSCHELLEQPSVRSLADLILDQCPDRRAPLRQMLACPERLLFILDGADELPAAQGSTEAVPCTDPFEATAGAKILGALLSKALLPAARLLVTTRAAVPGRLQGHLRSPQCAEVRGFSNKDKKKYFYKFFPDERRAERAYHFVKENETLFTLCFVPFVCWIVCSVLRGQLERGQDLARTSKTTTSVYLLFIVSLLGSTPPAHGTSVQDELRKLCRLAREGILGRRSQFSERDLERQELRGSRMQSLFLNKKEILGVLEAEVAYQFIDLSFQEFFAALSYLLEEDTGSETRAGGVGALLRGDSQLRGHLTLTTRFLFGLLSAEHMEDIARHFGCVVSKRVKEDVLRWVQGQSRSALEGSQEPEGLEAPEEPEEEDEEEEKEEEEPNYPLELLYCLYETQDDAFVAQALRGLPELKLERVRFSRTDIAILSYCVQRCPEGQTLRLLGCGLSLVREKKKSLVRRLQRSLGGGNSLESRRQVSASPLRPLCEAMMDQHCGLSSLTLSRCKLPDSVCRDLAEALKQAPALTELSLQLNNISPMGLKMLCEGLAWSRCRVQTFRVQQPGLQEVLQYLLNLLQLSPVLTTLDLSGCQLPDAIMTHLCKILQHPRCSLQALSLASVELTEHSLQELRAVKMVKPDLVITHPGLEDVPEPPEGVSCRPSEEGLDTVWPGGGKGSSSSPRLDPLPYPPLLEVGLPIPSAGAASQGRGARALPGDVCGRDLPLLALAGQRRPPGQPSDPRLPSRDPEQEVSCGSYRPRILVVTPQPSLSPIHHEDVCPLSRAPLIQPVRFLTSRPNVPNCKTEPWGAA